MQTDYQRMFAELQQAQVQAASAGQERNRLQNDVDCLIEDVASRERHMQLLNQDLSVKQSKIESLSARVEGLSQKQKIIDQLTLILAEREKTIEEQRQLLPSTKQRRNANIQVNLTGSEERLRTDIGKAL